VRSRPCGENSAPLVGGGSEVDDCDQTWTFNLLDKVLKQLAREYADTGRASQFEILQGAIGKQARQVSYMDLAARMRTSEGAVQQAVQRLRKR
jgi:hypothetical protein